VVAGHAAIKPDIEIITRTMTASFFTEASFYAAAGPRAVFLLFRPRLASINPHAQPDSRNNLLSLNDFRLSNRGSSDARTRFLIVFSSCGLSVPLQRDISG